VRQQSDDWNLDRLYWPGDAILSVFLLLTNQGRVTQWNTAVE